MNVRLLDILAIILLKYNWKSNIYPQKRGTASYAAPLIVMKAKISILLFYFIRFNKAIIPIVTSINDIRTICIRV